MSLNQDRNLKVTHIARVRKTYQSVIQSANKKKLAIGRELDEGDRRVLIVDQGLHTMAGPGIPNPTQAVIAAGDDQGAVAVEIYGCDGVGVGG